MSTKLNILPSSNKGEISLNKSGVELNELNFKAQGGTELMQSWLYERLPDDLKDAFQIICSRVRHLEENKPRLLWLHDLPEDPEAEFLRDEKNRKLFEKLIFVSNWQMYGYNRVIGVPYSDSVVIKNAIEPIEDHVKPKGGVKIIYHTTPHRGLNILFAAFQHLAEIHDDIELDVYSSFKLYGWEERDQPYLPLFEQLKAHPKVRYHGAVDNATVRKALKESHIFGYPSIWQETSCIAAIEALNAKNLVVCPNLGALPETTANFAFNYQYSEDIHQHVNTFTHALNAAINTIKADSDNLHAQLNFQKQYYDVFYGWEGRIQEWKSLMHSILNTKSA
jgi:UDP-glucose:(glucosyl)LPS alpha-1,2-glucosyltransferase